MPNTSLENLNYIRKFLYKYVSLKAILTVRLLLGHYDNLTYFTRYSFIKKLFCFSTALITLAKFVLSDTGNLLTVVESTVSMLLSTFVEAPCFIDFFDKVTRFDIATGPCHLSDWLYLAYFFILLQRIIANILYFLSPIQHPWNMYLVTAIEFGHFIRLVTFDMIYVRMKSLRISFENTFADVVDVTPENIIYKVRYNMVMCKLLQDSLQLLGRIRFSFLIVLVVRFVITASIVYLSFSTPETENMVISWTETLYYTVYPGILTCLPALFVELAYKEFDKIASILERQQQRYTDAGILQEVRIAIRFLELRPFRVRICRVLDVDSSLVFSYFSVMFTSALLILQLQKII